MKANMKCYQPLFDMSRGAKFLFIKSPTPSTSRFERATNTSSPTHLTNMTACAILRSVGETVSDVIAKRSGNAQPLSRGTSGKTHTATPGNPRNSKQIPCYPLPSTTWLERDIIPILYHIRHSRTHRCENHPGSRDQEPQPVLLTSSSEMATSTEL